MKNNKKDDKLVHTEISPNRDKARSREEIFEDMSHGIYVPVYYGTVDDALRNKDLGWMKESHMLDNECITAIRHFLFGRRIDPITQQETDKLLDKWGIERISYELACTVRYGFDNKYFTTANLMWAYRIRLTDDDDYNRRNIVDSFPENLNRLMDQVRFNIRVNGKNMERIRRETRELFIEHTKAKQPCSEQHETKTSCNRREISEKAQKKPQATEAEPVSPQIEPVAAQKENNKFHANSDVVNTKVADRQNDTELGRWVRQAHPELLPGFYESRARKEGQADAPRSEFLRPDAQSIVVSHTYRKRSKGNGGEQSVKNEGNSK